MTAAQRRPAIKPLFNADPADKRPTFGNMIRGARLGFHWSEPLQAMVRIDANGPPWTVTMCPAEKIPNGRKGTHLVWWEAVENPLAYSRAINAEAFPQNVVVFSIGEDGEKV